MNYEYKRVIQQDTRHLYCFIWCYMNHLKKRR